MNRKRLIGMIVAVCVIIGCLAFYFTRSQNQETQLDTKNTNQESEVTQPMTSENVLVAYFSMPETNQAEGMTQDEDNSVVVVDGEVLGNTQYVAEMISEKTNGTLYRIEPTTSYPLDHDTLVDQASEEQASNARPEIKDIVEGFEEYDTIYLGYPIWWSDMPQILYTFMETYDFTDKTVIPFSTHGGSGLAGTVQSIQEHIPTANIQSNALTLSRNNMEDAPNEVDQWLKEIGAIQ